MVTSGKFVLFLSVHKDVILRTRLFADDHLRLMTMTLMLVSHVHITGMGSMTFSRFCRYCEMLWIYWCQYGMYDLFTTRPWLTLLVVGKWGFCRVVCLECTEIACVSMIWLTCVENFSLTLERIFQVWSQPLKFVSCKWEKLHQEPSWNQRRYIC